MQYLTRQLRIGKTERLDALALEAGAVYTRTVVTFWRIVRRKGHWLSKGSMQRLIRNGQLHSQTVQGITDTFYESLKSWRQLRKTDPRARPPRRLHRYHAIPFKESAIKLKEGTLSLSTGKGNVPLVFPWRWDKPKVCEISFNGEEYVLNATYALADAKPASGTDSAGVDLGEIHLAVACTGKRVLIANGRELRSKRRYQNKVKAQFQARMARCRKGSRTWKRLQNAKRRVLKKLNNQIRDILHKQTTALVCALKEDGVQTVGIGDMRNLRHDVDYGRHGNQRIHQMVSGKTRSVITYKAKRHGMQVVLVDEAYTSQTCPRCGKRNKARDRRYSCVCGFQYHRDGVGAINIRSKTMYRECVPVVGDMTPPVGIRYPCKSGV